MAKKFKKVNLKEQIKELENNIIILMDSGEPGRALDASLSHLDEITASLYQSTLQIFLEALERLLFVSYQSGNSQYNFIGQILPILKSKIIDYEIYLYNFYKKEIEL